ncbi:MAG: TVP38/TMEM64 family protein [Negativicutes bacterium]|nr:TVP38/TMEM64 family protein [Negativicutes bacterium]
MERPAQNCIVFLKVFVLVLAAAAYYLLPGLQEFIASGIGYLRLRDFEGLRQFILSYGVWAPITSIALMTLQSAVPLVPGIAITITNAWIFGWVYGAVYSWTGALLGATLDFGIARWYGRPVVERFVNPKYLCITDKFFHRHGILAVFITRLTPVIPFKVVSYGAGLTALSLPEYLAATGIGQTPAIILYSFLGQNLTRSIKAVVAVTSLLIAAGALVYYYREAIEKCLFSNKD